MPTGTVKWFNNAKGYGFILPEGGGDDLFVHHSSISMDGYRTLKAGQAVEYEMHQGDKGQHATNVRCSGAAAAPDGSRAEPRSRPRSETGHGPGAYASSSLPGDGVAAAMLSAAGDD